MLPTATGWTAGAHWGHRAPACTGQQRTILERKRPGRWLFPMLRPRSRERPSCALKATVRGLGSCTPKGPQIGPLQIVSPQLSQQVTHGTPLRCPAALLAHLTARILASSARAWHRAGCRRSRRCACAVELSSIRIGAGHQGPPDPATTASHPTLRRRSTVRRRPAGCLGSEPGVVTTGWPRAGGTGAARSAGTFSPGCASSASHPSITNGLSCAGTGTGYAGLPRPSPRPPVVDVGEASSDGEAEGGCGEDDAAVQHGF